MAIVNIKLNANVPKDGTIRELPICTPVLAKDSDGRLVVLVRAVDEAMCFDPNDGSICYASHDYYLAAGYVYIRDMTSEDTLTIKGAA